MDLSEILASVAKDLPSILAGLPESELRAFDKLSRDATGNKLFTPTIGPQKRAYYSLADVLLFGGSPGGGKTALECGLALNEHHRALIVRREFVDLAGVLHTLDNIVGKQRCYTGGNRPVYVKPEGGVIDFMGLGDDLGGKQGNPHDLICCGLGTPVLMADGSFAPIEAVRPGQMVATLEGPRRVLRAFPSPRKASVRVTAGGVSQVQSASHKLLTTVGWVSHHAYASSSRPSTCAPTGCQTHRTPCAESSETGQLGARLRARQPLDQPLRHGWRQAAQMMARAASWVSAACMGSGVQGSAFAAFGDTSRATLPRQGWLGVAAELLQRLRRLAGATQTLVRCESACGGCDAPRTSKPQGLTSRCSFGPRPCGERIRATRGHHSEQAGGPQGLLLLADVGRQSPSGSQADGMAEAPTRSLHRWSYAHPYTKARRQSLVGVQTAPCEVEQVGEVPLFDLEIDDVRHFITAGGFINKNCVDEAAQVPEDQVRMLMGWMRTQKPGQRCRMVLGSNPPLDSTGDWLIEYFAPWLDPHHKDPAEDGELRFFLPVDGGAGYRECAPDEFIMLHGVKVMPQSRTFIASKFTDNPYYDPEQYAKALAGLPDSARNKLISGSFLIDRTDDEWQAIPTAWIRAAMERWRPTPPVGVPLCSIGADVAQGGADNTVLARRHDGWFAPLVSVPGKETPGGTDVAALVMKHRRDNAKVVIDVGGGWGGDAHGHLCHNNVDSLAYLGVKSSTARTKDNQLEFTNVRTEAYWRLREALDPDQVGGSRISLPNDNRLLADLTAPHYKVTGRGLELESKLDVVKRLGRSPDRGDAVVMAWHSGAKMVDSYEQWRKPKQQSSSMKHQPLSARIRRM